MIVCDSILLQRLVNFSRKFVFQCHVILGFQTDARPETNFMTFCQILLQYRRPSSSDFKGLFYEILGNFINDELEK